MREFCTPLRGRTAEFCAGSPCCPSIRCGCGAGRSPAAAGSGKSRCPQAQGQRSREGRRIRARGIVLARSVRRLSCVFGRLAALWICSAADWATARGNRSLPQSDRGRPCKRKRLLGSLRRPKYSASPMRISNKWKVCCVVPIWRPRSVRNCILRWAKHLVSGRIIKSLLPITQRAMRCSRSAQNTIPNG